jgi:putative transposase
MPDAMWEKIRLLLPDYETCLLGGRPRRDLRSVADAIFYRLRTGCQWKAIPKSLAPGSTAHAYFQEWVQLGIFARLWQIALELYDDLVGLDWRWQSVDGAMTKASWWRIDREKPNGSCEIGNKAIVAHRGRRNPNWFSRRRRQRA